MLIVVVGNGWRRHDEIAAGTFCQGPFCLCQVVAAGLGAGVVGAQYPLADCQGLAVHLDGSLVVAGGVIAVAQASPAAEGIGVVGAKGSGAALQSFPEQVHCHAVMAGGVEAVGQTGATAQGFRVVRAKGAFPLGEGFLMQADGRAVAVGDPVKAGQMVVDVEAGGLCGGHFPINELGAVVTLRYSSPPS